MPIDQATADWILTEVNALVDGAGVGWVKVRVGGRRVKRVFTNSSKGPPPSVAVATAPATAPAPPTRRGWERLSARAAGLED